MKGQFMNLHKRKFTILIKSKLTERYNYVKDLEYFVYDLF